MALLSKKNKPSQKAYAVVTGAGSGIGRSFALELAKRGGDVICADIDLSSAQETVDLIQSMTSTSAYAVHCDVGLKESVHALVEQAEQLLGHPVTLLINNAGMGMVGPVEDATQEEILQLMNLNVVGSVQMMSAVLPRMREEKSGKIINISSIGSEMGLPFRGFYSASKSALDKVTEAIRYEVSAWSIDVCTLHLGDIKTKIAENRVKTKVSEPYQKTFEKIYSIMNAHVDDGTEPLEVAEYIEKLLAKKSWKAHYYFGKFGQKIGVPLKWILPQNFYENLMRKYNQMD